MRFTAMSGATQAYSVGHWLREVARRAGRAASGDRRRHRACTFSALTEGLAEIPRSRPRCGPRPMRGGRREGLRRLLAELDADDGGADRPRKPRPGAARLGGAARHRARAGRLAGGAPAPPLLPLARAEALVLRPIATGWTPASTGAFDAMMAGGRAGRGARGAAGLGPRAPFGPRHRRAGAGGASARRDRRWTRRSQAAKLATRQYAKRQRTWFRSRMADWRGSRCPERSSPGRIADKTCAQISADAEQLCVADAFSLGFARQALLICAPEAATGMPS